MKYKILSLWLGLSLFACVKPDCTDPNNCGDPTCASSAVCTAPVCGDGVVDPGEQCDGINLNQQSCGTLGQGSGTLACTNLCLFDISGCVANGFCGDGFISGNEDCDGGDLGGADCVGLGFDAGTLACNVDCSFNTGSCTNNTGAVCGNGVVEAGEQCEPPNSATCDANCQTIGAADACNPPLQGNTGANNGSTTGAANFFDPSCQSPDTADVAFRFTPTTTAIDLSLSSATDEGIFVLDACAATGNELGCVDDLGGGQTEQLSLTGLTVGTPIFIFVGAFDIGEEGPFTLTIAANAGAVCGNNTVEAGEQCDDGNNVNTDACVACQNAACGDGFTRTGVEQCDDGNTTSGDGCSATCTTEGAGGGALLLTEIDYEQTGTDSNEFIEIKNVGNAAVNLSQFSLVLINGSTDLEYNATGRTTRIELSEAVNAQGTSVSTLQPGQFLVIASPTVTLPAGALRILVGASNNFQNGEATFDATKGDAVGILDNNAGQLVDALSYEGNTTAGNITNVGTRDFTEGTGTGINPFTLASPNESDDTNGGASLVRVGNSNTNNASVDWQASATPTPGA